MVNQNPGLFKKEKTSPDSLSPQKNNKDDDPVSKYLSIENKQSSHSSSNFSTSPKNEGFSQQSPTRSHKQNTSKAKAKMGESLKRKKIVKKEPKIRNTKSPKSPKTKKIKKSSTNPIIRITNNLMKQFNRSLRDTVIQSLNEKYGKQFKSKQLEYRRRINKKIFRKDKYTELLSNAQKQGIILKVIQQEKQKINKKKNDSENQNPKQLKFCESIIRSLELYQKQQIQQSLKALFLINTEDYDKALQNLQSLRKKLGLSH